MDSSGRVSRMEFEEGLLSIFLREVPVSSLPERLPRIIGSYVSGGKCRNLIKKPWPYNHL